MKRLLNATAIAVASALFLAGCGGGSDDPADPPDPAIAERGAIQTTIDAAEDAVGMVDNDADAATVMAADAAIGAARDAIEAATNVPATETAANTATVDALATILANAKAARDMAMTDAQRAADHAAMVTAERGAIQTAIAAAKAAVGMVDNDASDADVDAAGAAIRAARKAIDDATNVPATETAANTATVDGFVNQLTIATTARDKAIADAAEAQKAADAAMVKLGKDMMKALNDPLNATTPGDVEISTSGVLTIGGDTNVFKVGASAGRLGSWNGMDYARTTGADATKVTEDARVYTNREDPKSVAFAKAGYTIIETGDNAGSVLLVNAGSAEAGIDLKNIMATAFEHSGTQTHAPADRSDAVYIRGTFDGAQGEYSCTGTCTSDGNGSGAPSELDGTWHFKPDAGETVSRPDPNYLYYGWWVSKNSDNVPTDATAFAGIVGDVDNDGANATNTTVGGSLTGSAKYVGHAAGKFAMSNTIDGTGNGGHFTANAELNAKFGEFTAENENGVTGMIDNFRLNGESDDPGWSVMLERAGWGANASDGGALITAPAADGMGTQWSINGNKADKSGTWSGQMYDEAAGSPPDGDDNTLPTTVTGTFHSEYSTIGSMVGAFGANKE